jgi:hypothetical protein
MPPTWLKEGTKWGLGTVVGVLVTLIITSKFTLYAERPRPFAEIAQISITESDDDVARASLKRIVSVPLSDDLFSELAQSAWTEAFRDPSDVLPKVVSKLNRNREYVESYLRHAQSYFQLRKEMALLLNGERTPRAAENFFDDWQQIDGFIYGSVRSQMRYGASALHKIKCEQGDPDSHLRKLTYHKDPDAQYFAKVIGDIYAAVSRRPSSSPDQSGVDQSAGSVVILPPPVELTSRREESNATATGEEHIYSVTKIGGRYKSRFDVKSNLDENEIVTSHEEECAENVMAALADFDKEKLNAILDLADLEAKSFEMHKKIQSDIEKYIKGYSFWNVSMLVSNNGKAPISFSPNATLYVNMSDTKINGGNNLVVSLKKNGDGDSITIPGGESRSISLISSELVRDNEDWKNVIEAFEQSSRNCVVVLYPQTGDWQQDKQIFSPVKNFGPPAKASATEAQNISVHFKENTPTH